MTHRVNSPTAQHITEKEGEIREKKCQLKNRGESVFLCERERQKCKGRTQGHRDVIR
jgi:hypothetical protein